MVLRHRSWFAVVALLAALRVMTAESQTQAGLTIGNAGGSLAEAERLAFYEPFAAAHGVQIRDESFNQELAKVRLQVDTGNLTWDLVTTTAINEATGCEEGLFERVDWTRHIDVRAFAEVGGVGACGVPYMVISGGLAYDANRITTPPRTWADFWNVRRWPGKRGLLYRAEQTFEVALMADGVPPARTTEVLAAPGGIERAFRKLGELKPYIHWWRSGTESVSLLASGEVSMAYAWNGRIAAANRANHLNLQIDLAAGQVSGPQYWAILKGTAHRPRAIEFIKYATSPAPQADLSRRIGYGPAHRDAYPLLDVRQGVPWMRQPDRTSLQVGRRYLDFWLANGDALLQRFVTFAAR